MLLRFINRMTHDGEAAIVSAASVRVSDCHSPSARKQKKNCQSEIDNLGELLWRTIQKWLDICDVRPNWSYSTNARCHAPFSPWSVQAFSVNALSEACESAFTNLNNAQRALSNLLIARSRIMHSNKYETNYAPNVERAKHKKHDTINTILNYKRPDHVSDEEPAPRSNLFL